MKRISSRDNPQLKRLHALLGDARKQRREGRTVIEGAHLLAACLDAGQRPELLVLAEAAVADAETTALRRRSGDVETWVLRDALFNELSALAAPSGILARIVIPTPLPLAGDGDQLLLDAVQDAGNVGAMLRSAAAAGVREVLLGPGCAGAWTPRVLRAAQGAHFHLAIHERVDLAAHAGQGGRRLLAAVAHDGEPLYDIDLTAPLAWLFGNEGGGVAPQLEAQAAKRVTIPLHCASESLNVAAAAAVCLFEMRRQRR